MKTGIYPGTFDPVTNGHIDIIHRSLKIVDRLVVAVAFGSGKKTLFTIEERIEIIQNSLSPDLPVAIEKFDGLLVDFAAKKNASVIIRGLRAVSDFEYEFQMALMNKKLYPEIEVIFMAPDVSYTYISSSLVREVASLGGNVSDVVPKHVVSMLKNKFLKSEK